VLRVRELSLDLDRHEAAVADRPVDLTSTEFEFLRALMQAPDHAFTRAELIERALGYEYEGLERTIDSHIKNLRQKIEPDPRQPTYIQTVYGVGYRLEGGSV
jgi:two-component system alkaline phosphatase synthesis response regulator PhoP